MNNIISTLLFFSFFISNVFGFNTDKILVENLPDLISYEIKLNSIENLFISERSLRSRTVLVNPETYNLLMNLTSDLKSTNDNTPDFKISLFEDAKFDIYIERIDNNKDHKVITGRILEYKYSEVILLLENAHVWGYITAENQIFEIGFQNDAHSISEINSSYFLDFNEEDISTPTNEFYDPNLLKLFPKNEGSPIGVSIVYTNAVIDYFGSDETLNSILELTIAEMNQGFINSGIIHNVQLVGTSLVDYDELLYRDYDDRDEWEAIISRLLLGYYPPEDIPGLNILEDARDFRNRSGADLLVVIADLPDIKCGQAWLLSNFGDQYSKSYYSSMINMHCVGTGNLTIAHEIGHNLGSMHDRANSEYSGFYPYSNGYWIYDEFRTIMSYPDNCGTCSRINYWSNPNILYDGTPVGIDIDNPLSAHNALSINNLGQFVSNYRNIKAPTLIAPDSYTELSVMPTYIWSNIEEATEYILEIYQNGEIFLSKELSSSEICNQTTCEYTLNIIESPVSGSYEWRIISKNSEGTSPSTKRIVIIPGPPAIPQPIRPYTSYNIIDLPFQWYALPEAENYLLTVFDPNGQVWKEEWVSKSEADCESGLASCTYKFADPLPVEGTYEWNMKAANGYGLSQVSKTLWFSVLYPIPENPVKISPIPDSTISNQPTFEWQPVDTAYYYRLIVENTFDRTFNSNEVCSENLCSYTLSGNEILPSGSMLWWVKAGNNTGYSDPQGWRLIVEGPPQKPFAYSPGNPYSPTIITNINPIFKWYSLIEADTYQLKLFDPSLSLIFDQTLSSLQANCENEVGGSCNFYNPPILAIEGIYYWNITASNAYGSSQPSDTLYFDIVFPYPDSAELISPIISTTVNNTPNFSWKNESPVSNFILQIKRGLELVQSIRFDAIDICQDATCQYQLQEFEKLSDGAYEWTIVSETRSGENPSVTWSFNVIGLNPLPNLIYPDNGTSIETPPLYDWEDVADATAYQIQISSDPRFETSEMETIVINSTINPLLPYENKVYYWRVRAMQGDTYLPWSVVNHFQFKYQNVFLPLLVNK